MEAFYKALGEHALGDQTLRLVYERIWDRALEEAAKACEARATGKSALDNEDRLCAAAVRGLKIK
jgi:hypothetical protein